MDHYVFSAAALVLILASAALGSYLRARLADHHFSEDSLAAMRIAVGLVATLAAFRPESPRSIWSTPRSSIIVSR
jgi:hypothetical protein